ncbi:MAG TPA: PilZ domain-containing protein [Terriglobales bacterium]|nr:PilZ domain-containing protein [Terriglobales bacterium]
MPPLSFPGIHRLHKDEMNVALKNVFSALLLVKDEYSYSVAGKVLAEYGLEVNRVRSARELEDKIHGGRFDLLLVDAEVPDVLRASCFEPASRWKGVSIALRETRNSLLEHRRIHIILPRPLTAGVLSRGLRAAYSAMAMQKLLTFRHPVSLQPLYANLMHQGRQRTLERATVLNLSQTGLCLSAPFSLPAGAIVRANLPLPESNESVNISGTVIWSDDTGRAGLEFHQLSTFERRKLQEHLNARMPWRLSPPAYAS